MENDLRDLLILGGLGYIGTSLINQLDFNDFDNVIIIDLDLFKTSNFTYLSAAKIIIMNINK